MGSLRPLNSARRSYQPRKVCILYAGNRSFQELLPGSRPNCRCLCPDLLSVVLQSWNAEHKTTFVTARIPKEKILDSQHRQQTPQSRGSSEVVHDILAYPDALPQNRNKRGESSYRAPLVALAVVHPAAMIEVSHCSRSPGRSK